jgi:hypothetical protein
MYRRSGPIAGGAGCEDPEPGRARDGDVGDRDEEGTAGEQDQAVVLVADLALRSGGWRRVLR